jgi:glycosyltransferase involved in cell wall biosynthesis
MRVLSIVARGVRGRGGIERLYNYAEASGAFARHPDVEVVYFASRGDAVGAGWILSFPWRAAAFVAWMIAGRIDLVHINLSKSASAYRKLLLFYLARAFRRPILVHYHSGDLDVASSRPDARIVRHLCRRADGLIVLGEVWRQRIAEVARIPAEGIRVVANGVADTAEGAAIPRPADGHLTILAAGKVGAGKGTDILLDGLSRLEGSAAWSCTIAGDGEVAAFEAAARQRGLSAKVSFTGWVAVETVHALMRQADVVALPSRGEGLPVSLLEGACAGAALIATDVGAVRDVLHDGVNGLIVTPDAASLACALARLAADPGELAAMQSASRRIYEERFRVETMVDGIVAAYRAIVAGPP